MPTQSADKSTSQRDERELLDARFAMRLSLIVGVVMLSGKATAYFMTHSAAIFSDAAESVVHVIAVAFAAFSFRLSTRPAAPQFLYGYERITFFSAGFEGAMIIVAAIAIVVAAVEKWIAGLHFEHLARCGYVAGTGCWNLECRAWLLSDASRSADEFVDP
jgi:cation diffusion facilitator family transporter